MKIIVQVLCHLESTYAAFEKLIKLEKHNYKKKVMLKFGNLQFRRYV